MSAFSDVAREFDELKRRVEQLEALLRSRTSPANNPPRTAYRTREVAQLCGVATKTVRGWIADGRLEAEDMGHWWAVPASAVDRLIAGRKPRRSA